MPLGVPLVPITFPPEGPDDTESIVWIDLYDALYESKLLFLCRDIDTEVTNHLLALFMYLNGHETSTDFTLFINSPGGWVVSGMSIFNAMQAVTSDVRTVCVGMAASMASFLLATGKSFKRFAFPHARIMIHQPHAHFSNDDYDDDDYDDDDYDDDDEAAPMDDLDSLFSEVDELTVIQETIASVYARRTGQPLETILADLERDFYMSAREARDYGIIDGIGKTRRK
uniref:ATP-dependent Clp protease proteolytic subunit n=2 Tax=Passiflora TaxID=3684 RepID=A0A4Y5QDY0_9ROSI|nr:clp protease proteolytic subunit [Passiflora jatunsachensis]YP_009670494.1 clp protease proteolytic subunit [Passiflora jatunsachensis]YP_009670820.1 clp protease proteolytic subunit [Passiflora rufa]YP_009670865.1 clp protease proteolytic subunit [Passiflora rufa]QCX29731.1 clp protease proteolytic subunit [Passiflora jatunsachensis]QCX29732.1 clp protease proteolytic subunit [Passiflora jatunsachensis]QCX30103.1 clp protease proteolytic subunit [Passiflora rufa]QCX30104.1 clp protease p